MHIHYQSSAEILQKFIQQLEKTSLLEVFPEVLDHIESHMLHAVFLKNSVQSEHSICLSWNHDWLTQIEAKYPNIQIFSEEVRTYLLSHSFEATHQREYYRNHDVFEGCEAKIEQDVFLIPTLPSSETVFKQFIEGGIFSPKNEWILEYLDMYDDAMFEVQKHRYYIQIGGHGSFIQDELDGYIGQVNAEIGDAGSFYVYLEKDEIKAEVQMY